jgi:2',3'-cyclic-nucleotide 2'-phosphodiesterase (5'-nucleotidase family)
MRRWGRPLLLEVGDFVSTDPGIAAAANALILDQLQEEGQPVVTPGPTEFSRWGEFLSLIASRPIPVVSSNVLVSQDGTLRPAGARSALVIVEGVRVGVLGVLGEEPYQKIQAPQGLAFVLQDPAAAIRELLEDLRDRAELVVVMGCMTDDEAVALVPQVSGVDVLISGFDSTASDRPWRTGQMILNRTGQRGQYLSVTHLIVSPEGGIVDWGGRNVNLDVKVPTDARVDSLVARALGGAAGGCR